MSENLQGNLAELQADLHGNGKTEDAGSVAHLLRALHEEGARKLALEVLSAPGKIPSLKDEIFALKVERQTNPIPEVVARGETWQSPGPEKL